MLTVCEKGGRGMGYRAPHRAGDLMSKRRAGQVLAKSLLTQGLS